MRAHRHRQSRRDDVGRCHLGTRLALVAPRSQPIVGTSVAARTATSGTSSADDRARRDGRRNRAATSVAGDAYEIPPAARRVGGRRRDLGQPSSWPACDRSRRPDEHEVSGRSRRSCSPTSSIRPRRSRRGSAMTRMRNAAARPQRSIAARSSTGSVAARSITTGDGFLALFDGAARAVRCAAVMTDVRPAVWASRSGQGSTPARSRWPGQRARGRGPRRGADRGAGRSWQVSSPVRRTTCWMGPGWRSRTSARTISRASTARADLRADPDVATARRSIRTA